MHGRASVVKLDEDGWSFDGQNTRHIFAEYFYASAKKRRESAKIPRARTRDFAFLSLDRWFFRRGCRCTTRDYRACTRESRVFRFHPRVARTINICPVVRTYLVHMYRYLHPLSIRPSSPPFPSPLFSRFVRLRQVLRGRAPPVTKVSRLLCAPGFDDSRDFFEHGHCVSLGTPNVELHLGRCYQSIDLFILFEYVLLLAVFVTF